jgi:hypothetical protein
LKKSLIVLDKYFWKYNCDFLLIIIKIDEIKLFILTIYDILTFFLKVKNDIIKVIYIKKK